MLKRHVSYLIAISKWFFLATFMIFSLIFLLFGRTYKVISSSMMNSLHPGDYIWAKTIFKNAPFSQNIMKGSIIVFYPPYNQGLKNRKLVKRCLYLPGDTIRLLDHLEFSNSFNILKYYNLSELNQSYPINSDYCIVPYKGFKTIINSTNIAYFISILANFEKEKISFEENDIYIDGMRNPMYTFKLNYYFVVGDNQLVSIDSKKWGFLPESCITNYDSFKIFTFQII
jgi:signal peptidase I